MNKIKDTEIINIDSFNGMLMPTYQFGFTIIIALS